MDNKARDKLYKETQALLEGAGEEEIVAAATVIAAATCAYIEKNYDAEYRYDLDNVLSDLGLTIMGG